MFATLGLLIVLLGMLGGLFQCVYDKGGEGFEAKNKRHIIETLKEAEEGTQAAFDDVTDSLSDERKKVASLGNYITLLTVENDQLRKQQSEGKETLELGPCDWNSRIPWPDLKIDGSKIE